MEYILAALCCINTAISVFAVIRSFRAVNSAEFACEIARRAENAAAIAGEEAKEIKDTVNSELLPSESAARKAKEEIDRFNVGIYNILTYNGKNREANE